jgi:hypothetical protein
MDRLKEEKEYKKENFSEQKSTLKYVDLQKCVYLSPKKV